MKHLTALSVPMHLGGQAVPMLILDDDAALWVAAKSAALVLPGDASLPFATFFDARRGGLGVDVPASRILAAAKLENAGEGVCAVPLAVFRKLAARGGANLSGTVEAWAIGALEPMAQRERVQRRAAVRVH